MQSRRQQRYPSQQVISPHVVTAQSIMLQAETTAKQRTLLVTDIRTLDTGNTSARSPRRQPQVPRNLSTSHNLNVKLEEGVQMK